MLYFNFTKKQCNSKNKTQIATLDPITFPKAKSEELFNAAFILTMSSGAKVAKETTDMPIIIFGISNFKDKATADFNSQLPPKINNIKPPKINKKFIKKI